MTFVVDVSVLPRKEVLDVQGRAIAETLKSLGHSIEDCICGKLIRIKVQGENQEEALQKAKEMVKTVLCNPLVETYHLEISSL